jgi:glycosyltransferase involved in cell wall biosynthesis
MSRARSRRVLFVQATAERYGSDRSLLLLAEGLADRGWDITVGLPARGPLAGDVEAVGGRVAIVPVGAFRRVFTPAGWLRYLLIDLPSSILAVRRLARQADVVHLNTSILLGAALGARLARRPIVWHVRESYTDHRRQWQLYGRVVGVIATAVVANSTPIAQEAPTAAMRERITVIPNGLRFTPIRTRSGAREGVVAVGRINAGKGQDVLVDAIAALRDRGLILPTSIAGDVFPGGEEHLDRLRARIAAAGLGTTVSLLGFIDDIDSLLARHAIFVLPSRRPESFGLALIEAMAAGLPCIATDAGGPKEIVQEGVNGLLVPPGDSSALANALERLVHDPELCRSLGEAAAVDVRDRYDIANTVGRVEALYEEVLADRRRAV